MDILIVDHSRVFRMLWEKTARRAGLEPTLVETGAHALAILRQRNINLVCVSLTLTDMDGLEFCRRARSIAAASEVPIVLVTSAQGRAIRSSAYAAGATEILPKYEIETLFTESMRVAHEHQRHAAGRVLYVEDDAEVTAEVLPILKGMNLHVDYYNRERAAFDAFQREEYDVVIGDLALDGPLTGWRFFSRLHARTTDDRWVPTLGISDGSRTAQGELVRLGVTDFVFKPITTYEVQTRLRNLISNKKLYERVQQHQRSLRKLAVTDPLTGVYNRNALSEFVAKACAEANRHDLLLSVVLVDIDHFKMINDEHGHQTGDQALVAIADLLVKRCRKEDYVVRLGGDQLLLTLTYCQRDDAYRLAEELRAAVSALDLSGARVTASFGVAGRSRGQNFEMEELLRKAEFALSQAKTGGRNRVSEYTEQSNPGATMGSPRRSPLDRQDVA